jgi:hypothetical protein
MPDNHDIRILQWPKQKAILEHYFKLEEPCPVSIVFEDNPAFVKIGNDKEGSFDVDMNMNLKVIEDIPVCIKICEPICAVSDYTVGIELFGKPLASLNIRGKTKLGPCEEEPKSERICMDFSKLNPKKDISVPLTVRDIQFTPLDGSNTQGYTTMGLPAGQLKLRIPNDGLRIDFPIPVDQIELTIVNFGNPTLQINGFRNSQLISNQTEILQNETKTLQVQANEITAIEIKGGSNEAALVDVCFSHIPNLNRISEIVIN